MCLCAHAYACEYAWMYLCAHVYACEYASVCSWVLVAAHANMRVCGRGGFCVRHVWDALTMTVVQVWDMDMTGPPPPLFQAFVGHLGPVSALAFAPYVPCGRPCLISLSHGMMHQTFVPQMPLESLMVCVHMCAYNTCCLGYNLTVVCPPPSPPCRDGAHVVSAASGGSFFSWEFLGTDAAPQPAVPAGRRSSLPRALEGTVSPDDTGVPFSVSLHDLSSAVPDVSSYFAHAGGHSLGASVGACL
jgi:hypothetical protein